MAARDAYVFKSKNDLSRDELADLFATFADRIRTGSLTLTRGDEQVEIELPTNFRVDLQVKDATKRDRHERELEIEINWNVDSGGTPTGEAPRRGFTVS